MKISISSKPTLWAAALGLVLACAPTFAKDKLIENSEGTTDVEIAALKPLPAPSTIKVAVLPFFATSSDVTHVRMGTGGNWLLFQRQGFQMVPILAGFEAVKKDTELEPGLPLRKSDAVRLGKSLGADWVVYGEVKELRPYKKETFFSTSKLMWASMRLAVADVNKDSLIFWQSRSRRIGGTGIGHGSSKGGATLARTGVLSISDQSLTPLFEAMPDHPVNGNQPDSGDLAKFVDETWAKDK